VKVIVRSLIVVALLVSARIAYGLPFGELTTLSRSIPGPITESGMLALLGVAMLIFARSARRRTTTTHSQHF
jgi:hypothetical protein